MEKDWEDSNKHAFVFLLQTWLLAKDIDANECVRVLYEAMRIRKVDVPMKLDEAVAEFVDWQLSSAPRPSWIVTSQPVTGIAGF